MLPIQTILHPTDFSSPSRHAFALACSLAKDHGARVIVLHVVPPAPAIAMEGFVPPEPESERDRLAEMLWQIVPADPQVRVEHQLSDGNPAREILRVAQEHKCDLIVMGTHGRTGLSRLLMGSVAEHVVRKAACPVLTVKVPLKEIVGELTEKRETVTA